MAIPKTDTERYLDQLAKAYDVTVSGDQDENKTKWTLTLRERASTKVYEYWGPDLGYVIRWAVRDHQSRDGRGA